MTIPGAILLPAALDLYFAAWGWLANRVMAKRSSWRALLLLPASWVALEYLRSHLLTGFGWNLLAHTQWNWLPVIQMADLTGVWGVSFLVVLMNTAICFALKKRWRPLVIAVTCLAAAWAYGKFLTPIHSLEERFYVVALQGNIPQTKKWDEAFQEAIWKRYEGLMAEAVKLKPDLIVWPETAVPGYLEDPAIEVRLKEISRAAGIEMLVGLPTESPVPGTGTVPGTDVFPYNSALLLDRQGGERARYSKIHLVPFGEFIPIKPLFGWLKKYYPVADFAPGREWTVFRAKGQSPSGTVPFSAFSVLICFEDLFPELARRFVREGANWLIVITNDAWFGRSAASLQHLQASVFRAVENRIWVVRAANTGWTGFVDPYGVRLSHPSQVPRFKPGIAKAELIISPWPQTFYSRFGDWFPFLCLLLTACFTFLPSRRPL